MQLPKGYNKHYVHWGGSQLIESPKVWKTDHIYTFVLVLHQISPNAHYNKFLVVISDFQIKFHVVWIHKYTLLKSISWEWFCMTFQTIQPIFGNTTIMNMEWKKFKLKQVILFHNSTKCYEEIWKHNVSWENRINIFISITFKMFDFKLQKKLQ